MKSKKATNKSRKKRIGNALYLSELLNGFQWHSSMGFDNIISASQKNKDTMRNCSENRGLFMAAGYVDSKNKYAAGAKNSGRPGELLIHKSTRALWKISDDGKSIQPAFEDDIIVTGEDEA